MTRAIHLMRRNGTEGKGEPQNGILYPLDIAYEQAGVQAPVVRAISPKDIPSPYRSLLVHENDMTVTLERHFGGRVALRTLSSFAKLAAISSALVPSRQ